MNTLSAIEWFALATAAFSLFAAPLLLVAGLASARDAGLPMLARVAGAALLAGLAVLQAWHAAFLLDAAEPRIGPLYLALLACVATAFHACFRSALQPDRPPDLRVLATLAPVLVLPWLPPHVALPLAFALGAVYAIGLARLAVRLRGQRKRFRLEALAFAAHGLLALLVLALGLSTPWIGLRVYVLGYTMLVGLGLLAALYTLLRVPDVAINTAEAVRTAYAQTTLRTVDVEAVLRRLEQLMQGERRYADETLSLAALAQDLGLGPHQLSELINTRFGIGFPRYVREQRVRAAQRMLIDEPRASVLSVGLAVGFASQSNFYAAFREITGEVPGRFRRRERDPHAA